MKYQVQPGIVCTKIMNMNVLIPTRRSYAVCGSIQPISFLTKILWRCLEKGDSEEKALEIFQILTKKSVAELQEMIRSMEEGLCQKGFLIKVQESPEPDWQEQDIKNPPEI